MVCRYCKKDSGALIIVPSADEGEPFACIPCGVERGIFCLRHEVAHTGFGQDGSHACLKCIESDVKKNNARAQEIWKRLSEGLPEDEFEDLAAQAGFVAGLVDEEPSLSVLRFVLTNVHRTGRGIDEVIEEVLRTQSITSIV